FQERTGHAILERYGMTETGMITSNPYDGERRAGTVGMPLPGVQLRVADPETGVALPQGEIGVIEVRGPNVFTGYWRNPEKTAEEFREDGFFITGDLARIDSDGYVTIVGRDKDLIITGGFNVYPAEVEAVLDACPGIAESAVIGLPHPDFGEGVTGIVAVQNGAQIDEAAIQAHLAGELAAFKRPKRIVTIDALPRNTMGKIQKNDLRDRYCDLYDTPQVK
ncbi:MAG TPA: AMP-binding protein, partial [Afifellaceae bacterium]|nr:AMP-binding protein [Afifellaceae bacterium]